MASRGQGRFPVFQIEHRKPTLTPITLGERLATGSQPGSLTFYHCFKITSVILYLAGQTDDPPGSSVGEIW